MYQKLPKMTGKKQHFTFLYLQSPLIFTEPMSARNHSYSSGRVVSFITQSNVSKHEIFLVLLKSFCSKRYPFSMAPMLTYMLAAKWNIDQHWHMKSSYKTRTS